MIARRSREEFDNQARAVFSEVKDQVRVEDRLLIKSVNSKHKLNW